MADWFLIVHTPDGVHAHQVAADVAAGVAVEKAALMLAVDVPEDYMGRSGWSLSLAPGVPHPSLLQRIPADSGGVPLCGGCWRQS